MSKVEELRGLNDLIAYLVSRYEDLKRSDSEEDQIMADGIMIALPKLYTFKHQIEDRIKELGKKIEELEKAVKQKTTNRERTVGEVLAKAFGAGLYAREQATLKWVLGEAEEK